MIIINDDYFYLVILMTKATNISGRLVHVKVSPPKRHSTMMIYFYPGNPVIDALGNPVMFFVIRCCFHKTLCYGVQ